MTNLKGRLRMDCSEMLSEELTEEEREEFFNAIYGKAGSERENNKNGEIMPKSERQPSRMIIGTLEIKLYAPWVHSLKEKRMIVKSLTAKIRNKFNVSVIEAENQDLHQSIALGVACAAANSALADSIMDNVITFVEENTEAEITEIRREIR